MSSDANLSPGADLTKRRFLLGATGVVGGVGVAAAALPFVMSFFPSERAKAAGAPVEVDVGKMEPGQKIDVEWRGKVVWLINRTPEMLATLAKAEPNLADPGSAVESQQPDYARNAHGNLKEQNRLVGPQKGADTTQPEGKPGAAAPAAATVAQAAPAAKPDAGGADNKAAIALTGKHSCTACHGMTNKIVGPSFADIAKKHAGKAEYLAGKIKSGGTGVWGPVPMPPQSLSDADAKTIAGWLASGAGK